MSKSISLTLYIAITIAAGVIIAHGLLVLAYWLSP